MLPPHFLGIDGLNIVRRVYGANPAPDSDEKAAGALRASWASLRRAFQEHTPTHAAIAFDFGGNTWRHTLYSSYRQNRSPMPSPLKAALPQFYLHLQSKGLPVFEVPEVEADDTLTTLCFFSQSHGARATLLSTDKDLATLGVRGIFVRNHFENIAHDEAWCQKKFGIKLSQLADYLALMGDSTDGIPGVDGIGTKTAAKLLTEFGSLEAMLAHPEAIPGKAGKLLAAGTDLAKLSRSLVALKEDVLLPGLTFDSLEIPPGDFLGPPPKMGV